MIIDNLTTSPNDNMGDVLATTSASLLEYYKSHGTQNYEYPGSNKGSFFFITGKNEDENGIYRFFLPIHHVTASKKVIIFIDLRGCVAPNKKFETLSEIVRDRTLFNVKVTHGVLVLKWLESDFQHEMMIDTIKMFSFAISNIISNRVRLNILDADKLRVLLAYYYASIVFKSSNKDKDGLVVTAAKASLMIRKIDTVDEILDGVESTTSENVHDLVDLIKIVFKSERLGRLDRESIYVLVSNMLFGGEVAKYNITSLESPLVLMALLYNAHQNKIFKRSVLSTFLNNNARYLNTKEYVDKIDKLLK